MEIKLSICIPTYNYGAYIGETLYSILSQVTDELEVIVLDGGSTDETSTVIANYQRNYPQLSYYKQDHRGGIDRDIEKVVSLANGRYCWLFSADDIMLPNSLTTLLREIDSDHDIYICEHVLCNIELQPIAEYPPFNKVSHERLFHLKDKDQKNEYFKLARTSEAFFSFLAGPIFKKESWNKANTVIPESFYGTCWIVAGHLLSLFPYGVTVKYLNKKLIHKREGNDSFSNGSLVHRCKIGIENFHHIINFVFGERSNEAFHVRRVLQRDVPLRSLLFAKMRAIDYPEKEDINKLKHLAKMHYADATLSNLFNHLLFRIANPFVLKALYHFKLKLRAILK